MEPSIVTSVPQQGRVQYIVSQTWKFFFSILAPIIILPVFLWKPEGYEKAPYALYLLILMAAYWVAECIPLAITSLIPIVLVPLFGLSGSSEICGEYFNQTVIFLFGGCVVALAFEYSNLHSRISFFVMKSVGAQATTLLFGMMMTCTVLSCWMNNTSTTAMMVPVIHSIMEQYKSRLIPKETAAELAQKFVNPVEVPQYVESKAQIQENTTAPPPMAMNTPEVPRSNQVEPVDTNPSTQDPTDATKPGAGATEGVVTSQSLSNTQQPPSEFMAPKESTVAYWENVIESKKKYVRNLEIMFLIGVAVASNIGGTGVITGTGTNLIADQQLKGYKIQKNKDREKGMNVDVMNPDRCFGSESTYWDVDFLSWVILNFPGMLITTLVSWVFLSVFYQGLPMCIKNFWTVYILRRPLDVEAMRRASDIKQISNKIRTAIRAKYTELGRTTFHQWMILGLFANLVLLWIFKNPKFLLPKAVYFNSTDNSSAYDEYIELAHKTCKIPAAKSKLHSTWGWGRLFGDECSESFIHDYVATTLICFFLVILPRNPKYYKNVLRGGLAEGLQDPLLPLSYIAENIPWGPLIMLGGGFAISNAIRASKLDEYLSKALQAWPALKQMGIKSLLAFALTFVAILTTIASNTATAVIVCPILIELARVKGYPPLFLVIPPIIAASYAFCLPISTPPNAIVYDKAKMKQMDMFLPGIFLTVITNVMLFLTTITYTAFILKVSTYPGDCNVLPDYGNKSTARLFEDSTDNARYLIEPDDW